MKYLLQLLTGLFSVLAKLWWQEQKEHKEVKQVGGDKELKDDINADIEDQLNNTGSHS